MEPCTSYKRLSIGIDQSYSRCGISICGDGQLISVSSLSYEGCENKSQKRRYLRKAINKAIRENAILASRTIIIVERIRTFSANGGDGSVLSMGYIKATAALIATIVDVAESHGIKVYSVDTRSWKSQIVGSNKKVNGDPKELTIRFVENLGFDLTLYGKRGLPLKGKDNDAADSACIALYAFLPKKRRTLKLEE